MENICLIYELKNRKQYAVQICRHREAVYCSPQLNIKYDGTSLHIHRKFLSKRQDTTKLDGGLKLRITSGCIRQTGDHGLPNSHHLPHGIAYRLKALGVLRVLCKVIQNCGKMFNKMLKRISELLTPIYIKTEEGQY